MIALAQYRLGAYIDSRDTALECADRALSVVRQYPNDEVRTQAYEALQTAVKFLGDFVPDAKEAREWRRQQFNKLAWGYKLKHSPGGGSQEHGVQPKAQKTKSSSKAKTNKKGKNGKKSKSKTRKSKAKNKKPGTGPDSTE